MANTKLSAKRGLKMDTHIRRLLIIMVCWFIFMGIMKGRKFYSVVNFQTMFAQFPEFGLMSLGVMVCMISRLHAVIMFNTSGQTSAWRRTYSSRFSGFNRPTCPNLRLSICFPPFMP